MISTCNYWNVNLLCGVGIIITLLQALDVLYNAYCAISKYKKWLNWRSGNYVGMVQVPSIMTMIGCSLYIATLTI